ncbi:phosphatidylethanolamine-binding protein [Gymnopilus junonius]|uniref:Phosphatidylethanolamine-binding protein n=1 Tax=Gymnopilus junonius TaxID=109634 RepID=A0A9P5NM01_GYMJU|nr:phosphatidylethanolamine-binding protein [Gymnopilus junonius]
MFAVRRLPSGLTASLPRATRKNATLAVASSIERSSQETKTQGRRKRTRTTRPEISIQQPRSWHRALPPDVIPAYDLALQLLHKDSRNLKSEVSALRKSVENKETLYQALLAKVAKAEAENKAALEDELQSLDQDLESMSEKLNILEVQSEVNLPEVRWTVNNAMADMTKPSHRHLLEQKWRKDGDLDLLMERIYQMHVVPDVLPEINPSIDLRIAVPVREYKKGKPYETVEPGTFLMPKQTLSPPNLFVNVFHTDVRLYTMLLLDLDLPYPEASTYTTFLHWMEPNIPLSATSPSRVTVLNAHTPYIPPHPQQGTPYHRYVCLLLPQPAISSYTLTGAARASGNPTSIYLDIPAVQDAERFGFDVREFASNWALDSARGGAAHMWREVWDSQVSKIYSDILKKEEPRYGHPPKFNPYIQIKQQKKYIL